MALVCVTGCRECNGCMRCKETYDEHEFIGYCVYCDEAIYADNDYEETWEGLMHTECYMEHLREED